MSNDEYRMVLIVRTDLKMGRGKACAQCGHATLGAYKMGLILDPQATNTWYRESEPKIVLKVDTEEELIQLANNAVRHELPYHLVVDAGRTQIAPGSKTVLGIGPARASVLNQITGHLKLY